MMLAMNKPKLRLLQTLVPPTEKRRVEKLANGSGTSCSAWLRQLVLVATQDSEAGRQVRSIVAQTLAMQGGQ
jgi:hypothetical protein